MREYNIETKQTAPPKMKDIAEAMKQAIQAFEQKHGVNIPVWDVGADEHLCSSVRIEISLDPKEEWNHGIFHNSRSATFSICPKNGRYYEEGQKVEFEQGWFWKVPKMRKLTTEKTETLQKRLRKFLNDCLPHLKTQ